MSCVRFGYPYIGETAEGQGRLKFFSYVEEQVEPSICGIGYPNELADLANQFMVVEWNPGDHVPCSAEIGGASVTCQQLWTGITEPHWWYPGMHSPFWIARDAPFQECFWKSNFCFDNGPVIDFRFYGVDEQALVHFDWRHRHGFIGAPISIAAFTLRPDLPEPDIWDLGALPLAPEYKNYEIDWSQGFPVSFEFKMGCRVVQSLPTEHVICAGFSKNTWSVSIVGADTEDGNPPCLP